MNSFEKLPKELIKSLNDCKKEFNNLSKIQKLRLLDYTINHCWIEGDKHSSVYYATQINKLINLKNKIEKL